MFLLVLFTLSIISYSISVLNNQQQLIAVEEEQFRMETLLELALSSFRNDFPHLNPAFEPETLTYQYLYGKADIHYYLVNTKTLAFQIHIQTQNGQAKNYFFTIPAAHDVYEAKFLTQ